MQYFENHIEPISSLVWVFIVLKSMFFVLIVIQNVFEYIILVLVLLSLENEAPHKRGVVAQTIMFLFIFLYSLI